MMGVQLNIKSDEAYALATELAATDNVSMTQVVVDALRARKFEREREAAKKLEEVMAIVRDMRARLGPGFFELEHGDLLYDDLGLPK